MAGSKQLYDLDVLRNIPILDVCDYLGLPVEKRGKNFWCKVRTESKASVILHTDTNHFYDFGNQEHGNVIDLVKYARGGIAPGEAIRELAQAFQIAPSMSRGEKLTKPMNAWEYKKIGLHGDLATKNIIFPVEILPPEKLLELELAFKMPMNKLRKECPRVYQHILETKALPFVRNKRDLYHLSVWNYYEFLSGLKRSYDFFDSEKTAAKFELEKKGLEQSERALYKACLGTEIQLPEPHVHDPQRVFSLLKLGKLEIPLSPYDPQELAAHVQKTNCGLFEGEMAYGDYCSVECDEHLHVATLKEGRVHLSFPGTEKGYFDRFCSNLASSRPSLSAKIAEAAEKQATQAAQVSERTPEPVR